MSGSFLLHASAHVCTIFLCYNFCEWAHVRSMIVWDFSLCRSLPGQQHLLNQMVRKLRSLLCSIVMDLCSILSNYTSCYSLLTHQHGFVLFSDCSVYKSETIQLKFTQFTPFLYKHEYGNCMVSTKYLQLHVQTVRSL